jgi:hypothetical protein
MHRLAFLLLSLIVLPASAEICTIVGSFPYKKATDAFARAEAARKAGFDKAAVYDTRDTETLAWGGLAIVARVTADKKEARAAVKALKKAKLKAYSRRCELGMAEPLKSAKAIRPLPKLGKAVKSAGTDGFDSGCFGYSPKRKQVLCVVGPSSNQQEENNLGALLLPSGVSVGRDAASVNKLLKKGDFQELPEPARMIEAPGTTTIGRPRAMVRFSRKFTGQHSEETGSWPQYDDALSAKCAGTERLIMDEAVENPEASVQLTPIPGTDLVLVVYDMSYGIEGEFGSLFRAYVLDTTKPGCADAP